MFDLNFGLKLYDFCNKQGFNFDYCLINVDVYFSDILSQDLQASVEQLQDGLSQEVEELPTVVDDNFMLSNDAGRSETQDNCLVGSHADSLIKVSGYTCSFIISYKYQ
jgi:hypothetical protein